MRRLYPKTKLKLLLANVIDKHQAGFNLLFMTLFFQGAASAPYIPMNMKFLDFRSIEQWESVSNSPSSSYFIIITNQFFLLSGRFIISYPDILIGLLITVR